MTTLGVRPAPTQRVLPMNVPSYSYMYPSLQTIQLAAVKEGLYHPNLPSFRRMDMDTAAHRLPDEHCRTTTGCAPEDFGKATMTQFTPSSRPLTTAGITETGRQLKNYYAYPHELRETRVDWGKFLDKCPERYNIRLANNDPKDLHFTGYAVRYLRPELTNSWRYKLRQEPSLDVHGQRPVPATAYSRYRDTAPKYSRNISTGSWK